MLASSAFPAVFRPRELWEIFGATADTDKYIDGGTIDNLPLDAVARFLDEASSKGRIPRRSRSPHLLFTASLEVDREVLSTSDAILDKEVRDFVALSPRVATFQYNRKVDAYASVQRGLTDIHSSLGTQNGWEPLNLHVIAVKPNWLCHTFGFHPMLGFRRKKQAESIAHGCATTLAALHDSAREDSQRVADWGVENNDFIDEAMRRTDENVLVLWPQKVASKGDCWFRRNARCPYSEEEMKLLNASLKASGSATCSDIQIEELRRVYEYCGKKRTHEPAP